eukprot:scpid26268/ scgid22927/ 
MSAGGVQLSSRSSINMAVFKRSRWKSVCDRGPFGVFWMLFLVAFSMRIGGSLGNGDGSLATVDSTGQWSEAGGETEMTTDNGEFVLQAFHTNKHQYGSSCDMECTASSLLPFHSRKSCQSSIPLCQRFAPQALVRR